MIFYFTGTGNSQYAASKVGQRTGETPIAVTEYTNRIKDDPEALINFDLDKDERIGIVFPVHSWGPPSPVLEFIDRLSLTGYKDNYIYCIITCGENIGNTVKTISKRMKRKNYITDSAFSVAMPNNFMIFGNVYSEEKCKALLEESEKRLEEISDKIYEKKRGVFELRKGPVPFIMTGLFHKGFKSFKNKAKYFYATDDCRGKLCSICAKVCPTNNIEVEQKPVWGKNCTLCTACINYCPVRAVQYGKKTVNKGRYTHPDVNRINSGSIE